jgi:hypothetical protein
VGRAPVGTHGRDKVTSSGVPTTSDAAIRAAIEVYPAGKLGLLAAQSDPLHSGCPLVIKYIPARYAAAYHSPGGRLRISDTAGFTWGTGTYVAPLANPISSAIFGRIGVVAKFDPAGWRVFDATQVRNQDHYLSWAAHQILARQAALTAQSAYYNQQLRDQFRLAFNIDCVLFPPDQTNTSYTDPADVWMTVTDWTGTGGIGTGASNRFTDPMIVVLADDEFEDEMGGTVRRAILAFTSSRPSNATVANAIAGNYAAGSGLVRIKA